jgi:hypothetical protein
MPHPCYILYVGGVDVNVVWVNLRFACYGVLCISGVIRIAPPIACGWIGKHIDVLVAYYKHRGDYIAHVVTV